MKLTILAFLFVAFSRIAAHDNVSSSGLPHENHNHVTLRPFAMAFGQSGDAVKAPNVSFRYVIVFNGPLHNGRLIQVLMDPKAFSETNLRQLFSLVSKRFPEPEELHVGVFTSLEQLPTPEEQDYMLKTNSDRLPFMDQINRWPGAVYSRNQSGEAFKYSFANEKDKTVVLKGGNPFERDKK